jgi:hypothetical protein
VKLTEIKWLLYCRKQPEPWHENWLLITIQWQAHEQAQPHLHSPKSLHGMCWDNFTSHLTFTYLNKRHAGAVTCDKIYCSTRSTCFLTFNFVMNCVIIYSWILTLKIICTLAKNRMDMHHNTWTDPCPQCSILLHFTWESVCITFLKTCDCWKICP